MGIGTILVVCVLGWRLGGRWPALLAALGVAIYPPFIHSVGEIMSEPPAMLSLPAAILAFLWAWDRTAARTRPGGLGRRRARLVLARPRDPLRLHRHVPARVHARRRRLRRLRRGPLGLATRMAVGAIAVALMLPALLLPIVPWTVRNFVVFERLVPISTGSGKALYVGTFYPADGEYRGSRRS